MAQPLQQSQAVESQTVRLYVTMTVFFVIALLLCLGRFYLRVKIHKFGIDDWFLAAGMASVTGLYIVSMIDVHTGLGKHIYHLRLDQISMAARLGLFVEEFYVYSVTFVKISIAIVLLRILGPTGRAFTIGLYLFIGLVVAVAIACSCWDWLQCRPIQALWDWSLPREACMARHLFRDWMLTGSSLFFFCDIVLSLMPIFLVKDMNRPVREKLTIIFLMSCGIVASAAVIPKVLALRHYTNESDFTWIAANVVLWSTVEPCLGIIACSIPAYKKPFDKSMATFKSRFSSLRGSSTAGPSALRIENMSHDGSETVKESVDVEYGAYELRDGKTSIDKRTNAPVVGGLRHSIEDV